MQWSCWRTHWLPVESRLKWDSFDFDMPYNNQRNLNCPFLCDHDWCWKSYGMKWSFLLPGRQLIIHVCAQGKWCIREVVSPERLQAEVCCKTVELQLAVEEGNMCSKWQQQLKMRANELNVATTKKTLKKKSGGWSYCILEAESFLSTGKCTEVEIVEGLVWADAVQENFKLYNVT